MKRSTYDMSLDVLQIMDKVSIPSKIMFAANMSWNRFMMIIAELKAVGLVEEKVLRRTNNPVGPGRRCSYLSLERVSWRTMRIQRRYALTDKGRKVLSLIKTLNELTKGLGIIAIIQRRTLS